MPELSAALTPSATCFAPQLYDLVTEYCFDQLPPEDMIVVEKHLAVCPFCGQTVDNLQQGLGVLRFDPNSRQDVLVAETVGVFGVSGKLNQLFGGHKVFVIVSCVAYALLHGLSVVMEISREFGQYANIAIIGSILIAFWTMLTSFTGLLVLWRRTVQGKPLAVLACLSIFSIATGLLMAALFVGLPVLGIGPIFPEFVAPGGCVRNYATFLGLGSLYFVIPYHFILTVQRELQMGRHSLVLSLLAHERGSIPPRGTLYLRVWWMMGILTPLGFLIWQNTEWYIRSLQWWPYKELFISLLLAHWFSFLTLGTLWMIWYQYKLNEVKRECVIMKKFSIS